MKTYVVGDIHGAHKALIQCLNRSNINKEKDHLIFMGDIVDGWSESPECIDTLLSFKYLTAIRGNHDCFDINTEVFTKKGWKTYLNIDYDDEVLGLNKNGFVEWQGVNDIIILKNKELYEYNSEEISMCITDKHRILHKTSEGYKYDNLKNYDSNDGYNIPLSGEFNINTDYSITDSNLQIVAWILIIKNIDEESKEVLKKQILKNYKISLDSEYFKQLIIDFKLIKDSLPEWVYLLSSRQIKLFINELILINSILYPLKKQHTIYGTYKFLSMIQGLCSMGGITAKLNVADKDIYILSLDYKLNTTLHNEFIKKEGLFTVWDLTVPLSNMLVRRNGKAYYTGNSWFMDWAKTKIFNPNWYKQGGKITLKRYENNEELVIKHMDMYFNNTKIFYIDKERNFAFMHGGYNWNMLLTDNDDDVIMWNRRMVEIAQMREYSKLNKQDKPLKFEEFDKIFVGHTTTQYSYISQYKPSLLPAFLTNLINVDTGAGWDGKLTIMDIDTMEYWQSDLVESLYPDTADKRI